jgi:hypothetical protein
MLVIANISRMGRTPQFFYTENATSYGRNALTRETTELFTKNINRQASNGAIRAPT